MQGMAASRFGIEIRRSRKIFGDLLSLPSGVPATLLDIGANEGQFTRRFRAVVPRCVVHCFEPVAAPFGILQARTGNDPDIHCHNFALGDRAGHASILTGKYSPTSSLLSPAERLVSALPDVVPDRAEEVEIVRLDSWAASQKLQSPIFIKMDVQGYELKVIESGPETVAGAAALFLELSFVELYQGQPLVREVVSKLGELGFEMASIYDVAVDGATGLGFQFDALFLPRRFVQGRP